MDAVTQTAHAMCHISMVEKYSYYKEAVGHVCAPKTLIDTDAECRIANSDLALGQVTEDYKRIESTPSVSYPPPAPSVHKPKTSSHPGGCFFKADGASYFNKQLESTGGALNVGAICRSPFTMTFSHGLKEPPADKWPTSWTSAQIQLLEEGIKPWTNREYRIVNLPKEMIGATLFPVPYKSGAVRGTIIMSSAVTAQMYVMIRKSAASTMTATNHDGGVKDNVLRASMSGWVEVPVNLKHLWFSMSLTLESADSLSLSDMILFRKTLPAGATEEIPIDSQGSERFVGIFAMKSDSNHKLHYTYTYMNDPPGADEQSPEARSFAQTLDAELTDPDLSILNDGTKSNAVKGNSASSKGNSVAWSDPHMGAVLDLGTSRKVAAVEVTYFVSGVYREPYNILISGGLLYVNFPAQRRGQLVTVTLPPLAVGMGIAPFQAAILCALIPHRGVVYAISRLT
jgi:hypothetical protein